MKNVKELIQILIDASLELEKARFNAKMMNQQYEKIRKIRTQLKSMGDDAVEQIIPLLNHENIYVRYNAAFFMIPIDPQKARETLLEISEQRGSIGHDALMTIRQWDEGNLKF